MYNIGTHVNSIGKKNCSSEDLIVTLVPLCNDDRADFNTGNCS